MVNNNMRVFLKFLFLAFVFIFFSAVFSCKSTVPLSVQDTGAAAAGSFTQPALEPQAEPAAGQDAGTEGSGIDEMSAGGQADEEKPITALPPGTPSEPAVEAAPVLPEPEAPVLPSSQDSTPPEEAPGSGLDEAQAEPPEPPEPAAVPVQQAVPEPQAEIPAAQEPSAPESSQAEIAQTEIPPPPLVPEQSRAVPESNTPQQVPSAPSAQPPKTPPSPPPSPPSFLKPAEPEISPPAREQVPMPVNPLPELPVQAAPEPTGDQITFSRVVRATVGQVIEIPFRGTGWVYLGELGNRRGIVYESRRLDLASKSGGAAGTVDGQSFIFTAEAAGTYILKFYKQDFIQDYIINDYVQVIVGEAAENTGAGRFGLPKDQGRVIAEPRWPPLPEPPANTQSPPPPSADSTNQTNVTGQAAPVTQTAPQASTPTPANTPAQTGTPPQAALSSQATPSPQTASTVGGQSSPPPVPAVPVPAPGILSRPAQGNSDDSISPVSPPQAAAAVDPNRQDSVIADLIRANGPPSVYVSRAKQEFDAGRIDSALTILDTMKQRYPSGTDEAWWLYGQLLEANSSSRDIRLALDYYRRLVNEYPQSPRAGDAQRRIAYLERYYINIR